MIKEFFAGGFLCRKDLVSQLDVLDLHSVRADLVAGEGIGGEAEWPVLLDPLSGIVVIHRGRADTVADGGDAVIGGPGEGTASPCGGVAAGVGGVSFPVRSGSDEGGMV